ncbi:MAG TPA: FumA C-terminus/TtdB family hydratase beta subunit [Oscillospiraceae bacterium]|nr:FumA C-terminus/TtdB family hydratase beta subunit [Oscillospiraceae bacterium]HPF55511.1 FumA C-terminus/TtdB family hydratase beta subunit [Clostridiales bacterium]HPK35869.1 FumA C-terminus/TtdB family hydratase beta subunit [Oscillospiraceae bacterium]HPR76578.1 FumA C-terminus/TtdB family hydratase beta subunit [Oscillospiraceae bacterium]
MTEVTTKQLAEKTVDLHAGDDILLTGTIYTARDAAHKRLAQLIEEEEPLPFELNGAIIYYCGPTPAPEGMVIGSCGPTTSSRMDPYTPRLYGLGLTATIGKGRRSSGVISAIQKNKAYYLCALGGCGALIADCVKSSEVVAFADLGCEAIRKLEVENLPLIVGIDPTGESVLR